MCSIVLPAGRFFGTASVAPPPVVLEQSTSMAACFEAPPPVPPCVYDATAASAEMEEVLLRGTVRRVGVVEAIRGFFFVAAPAPVDLPVPVYQEQEDSDDTPRTPVAILKAPLSYGDEYVESSVTNGAAKTEKMEDPSWTYDADIDATLRSMEMDPAERPSEDYIWTKQEGQITAADRADLVAWMYDLSRTVYDELPPDTLHRAVSYVDRFLSANKVIVSDRLRVLGAAAVFAAAKYDERWVLDPDDIAWEVGGWCARRDVLDAERELVAALAYRLGGPTACTFADHFTRFDGQDGDEAAVRSLAHLLADLTLLDYRCVPFLPSAVAAAAILLARRVVLVNLEHWSGELSRMTGYTVQDLTDVVDAIYEMHDPVRQRACPGVALIMDNYAYPSYSLPSR
jgi:cyclin-A